MIIDSEFLNALKAINLINSGSPVSGAVFKKGHVIKAHKHKSKIPVVIINLSQEIPVDFALYDLKRFISVVSMLDNPVAEFYDTYMLIKSGKNCVRFRYSEPLSDILSPGFYDVNIQMPEVIFQFELNRDDFNNILSAAIKLGSPQIALIGDKTNVNLCNYNIKDANTDKFNILVGKSDIDFTIIIDIDILNFVKTDYNVYVTEKGLIKFESKDGKIVYYITFSDKSKVVRD